jgi:hypothetical protein
LYQNSRAISSQRSTTAFNGKIYEHGRTSIGDYTKYKHVTIITLSLFTLRRGSDDGTTSGDVGDSSPGKEEGTVNVSLDGSVELLGSDVNDIWYRVLELYQLIYNKESMNFRDDDEETQGHHQRSK